MVRGTALVLTVLTGFSALVYQVAWQRFLATLLGSHSEATAAVLGIFLGGLSIGYALFGRLSRNRMRHAARRNRRPGLLLFYGIVESAIGVYALLFPLLFAGIRAISLQLPDLPPGGAFAVDVLLTAILMGPPTILMGGTIPLLTQGLSRSLEDATRFHAFVYACNTTGAFAGALAAGFVLVPWLGLELTMTAMGLVNLAAGLTFALLHKHEAKTGEACIPAREDPAAASSHDEGASDLIALCTVVLLAGFAMMTLQTVLNRIGALALGSSHFTFSMIVATFVLCIALGSFAVSALRRVRAIYLVATQWLLVAILLLLYGFVEDAGYWAHILRTSFPSDPSSFYPYTFTVFSALLAVSCVPLGLSGALLPLVFHRLRRRAGDLGRMAGWIYSWNTLGSLLGALLGGYLLLFWLDLHDTYRLAVLALAAAAAITTGLVLPRMRLLSCALVVAVAGALVAQPSWDQRKLSAGLFRYRTPVERLASGPDAVVTRFRKEWVDDYVLFYDDDPASSVAVFEIGDDEPPRRSIIANGKSDGNIPSDNMTTGLLALLPALFAEKCERAFVIGYGTGMSVGELAALDSTEEVTVAEISSGVIRAAPLFEEINRHALASPKTRVIRSDAYRALLREQRSYDVIVSEPSNPWVTGVEMLYSREFLEAARDHLAPGGVYSQWFHIYESDDRSIALVLNTFRAVFPRTAVWIGAPGDLILLGFEDPDQPVDLARLEARWKRDDFNRQLKALPLQSFPRLLAHELLPLGVLEVTPLPDRIHTILHPRLSHDASRAFFVGHSADVPTPPLPTVVSTGARNSLVARYRARLGGRLPSSDRLELLREACTLRRAQCATLFAQWIHEEPQSRLLARSLERAQALEKYQLTLQPAVLDGLVKLFGDEVDGDLPATFEVAADLTRVFIKYYHHAAPFTSELLDQIWRRCEANDERCAARLDAVRSTRQHERRLSRR